MFYIKIKVKGFLQNLNENTKEIIDTNGIISKNKLIYVHNSIKHKLDYSNGFVILVRENDEFHHKMNFTLNQITKTNYYVKSLSASISIKLLTTKINISDNKIEIHYQTIDESNQYIYIIEMSDK